MAASAPISTTELVSAIITKPASTRSITKPLCFEKADVTTRACWDQSVSRHCGKRIKSFWEGLLRNRTAVSELKNPAWGRNARGGVMERRFRQFFSHQERL